MTRIYHFIICSFLLTSFLSNAQFSTIHSFDGAANGAYGSESLFSDGTSLYGMTLFGGANNAGIVYKINFDGTGFTKLLDFDGAQNGSLPRGSLISDGTYLYGMTQEGGVNDLGTIFKILPDGTGYSKLLDFDGNLKGGYPSSTLFYDGVFLYGMAGSGGANGYGTLFKIMPDGSNYIKLMDFNGSTNGKFPEGPLISDGTFLYGVTPSGGNADLGTIFKIMPDGSGYIKLRNFAGGIFGSTPRGALVSDGTFLYGMTTFGGTDNRGIIYKITPSGTGFTKLKDFTGGLDGGTPVNNLIFDGNYLIGMTSSGGLNNSGIIFRILPDGTSFENLFDFGDLNDGSYPNGALIIDGNFLYGNTESGGTNGVGVIFKFERSVGLSELGSNHEFTVYPNPASNSIQLSSSSNGIVSVQITNVLGSIIYHEEVNLSSNSPHTIDLSEQKKGVYLIQVGNCTKRLIVE